MEKFKQLVALCKASVNISVNDYKDYYQSVESYLEEINEDDKAEIPLAVIDGMIERDIVVRIQAYPNTPIGSYTIHHYDIDVAVDLMIKQITG